MKTSLKIEPVLTKKAPKYPDKYSVALDKMLLGNTPARWNTPLVKSITGTALSFSIMATLAGCAASGADTLKKNVAPLFVHGEGTGTVGCMSVVAVHFLSEEDALQIITDEFAKHGLTAIESSRVLYNIQLPLLITRYDDLSEKWRHTNHTGSLSLDLDLVEANVSVEFVSTEDYRSFPADYPEYLTGISVMTYNIKPSAEQLVTAFKDLDNTDTTYATFYDPAFDRYSYVPPLPNAEITSDGLLREQVRDFIEWLAAQGVI